MVSRNQYYPESVTHPGEILSETLEENGLGPKEFAIRTGKPEKTISALLHGDSAVTADMAILFEQVLNIPAHFWMEAQRNFDENKARKNYQKTIAEAIEWAKSFPYAEMAKLGWVPQTRKAEEKVIHLFEYFQVANVKAWNDYYFNQKLQIAFRVSLKNNKNAGAIAAWLRQGEIQAQRLHAPGFDKGTFKETLPHIKKIMAGQPDNFFKQLQELALQAGVKIVHTPCLPKVPVHGATRWFQDIPLIQLSGRYKRNDIFWFTFFHEVGHILLHGKKYISIENIDYTGEIKAYEDEANAFAMDWILSYEEEKEIAANFPLSDDDIVYFAKKFTTHPALIVGRLQHKGIVPHGIGNHLFKPIDFYA